MKKIASSNRTTNEQEKNYSVYGGVEYCSLLP